jgi:chromosome partitioning protein
MQNIVIVNTKGGSGKSTLATNLAGYYACWGIRVALVDHDPQQSSQDWLRARPSERPQIVGMSGASGKGVSPLVDYVITDLASGVHPNTMASILPTADVVLIPVLPSPMDIRATGRFIFELLQNPAFNEKHTRIGVVANRVRENTRVYAKLRLFLGEIGLPFVGSLRETQNYITAAEQGLSLFELPKRKVIRDLLQWQPLITWLSNGKLPVLPPQVTTVDNSAEKKAG